MRNLKIGIIGCGNMGAAIINALAKNGVRVTINDLDGAKVKYTARRYRSKIASSNVELVKRCGLIILAVKPGDIEGVLRQVKRELGSSKLLISIAAGVGTKFIEKKCGGKIAVIRVMPNMPALIGAGISAMCKGRFAAKGDLVAAKRLFSKLGEVVEVKEHLMDAVTAISGSGPAYFFYLVEVLVKAAVDLGLKKETAEKLAIETALGSARVLKETGEAHHTLRAKITSKGGTTEAAFKEFFKGDIGGVLKKGIRKAFERARKLCRG